VLLACGFKIVRLPLGVYDSFAAAGVDVRCVAPRAVIDFFARFQNGSCHCGLPVLPADVATTPFGSNVALKVVHDYCSQVRTIHPFYRSNDTHVTHLTAVCLQCFDAVGWAAGTAYGL